MSDIYLKHGEVLLGVLSYSHCSQPWFYFDFEATPQWDETKHLFDARHDTMSGQTYIIYNLLRDEMRALDLRLVESDDGSEVDFTWLQIDDEQNKAQFG